ncbi:rod shape-determining protein MreD [Gammaproteobacteria bacterium]|nr:rod shape-determining protein MreD [Gammaproteobacteria bacterium]
MKLSSHLFIFLTIFSGFWLDSVIATFNIRTYITLLEGIPYLVETCIGFLILSYWIYALPEKIQISAALFYGLLIDLFFGSAIGFNMLFFSGISYVIHVYVFRFRIFSYLQLIIFFGGASIFYIACKYLIFSPENYSYLLLLVSFFINALLWLPIYYLMRSMRRTFL